LNASRGGRRQGGAVSRRRRKRLPALVVAGVVSMATGASAQDTRWDAILSNSNWYVPVPGLVAYATSNSNQTINPIPIGDQTLWALGTATNGVFSGQSLVSFAIGGLVTPPGTSSMQGIVTEAGQIRIAFSSSDSPTIIGIGQMREISGVPLMEMQMITGSSLLITHWAYMTPYNPAIFTPPSPTQYVSADVTSPQWRWTAGTTWRVSSQTLFGTAAPGTFKISDYSNGYYWGMGAAPQDSTVGNFTVLGSMTPEGNVLFNFLLEGGSLNSLSGQITGDATTGTMVLRPYTLSGTFGDPTLADIMPVSTIATRQTYFLSNVGSTVIPAFTGGTLQVDTTGGLFSQNFIVDGSATNRLDLRGNSAVLSGVLSDAVPGTPGNLTIANSGSGGSVSFTGNSTYTGPTTIDAGAILSVDGSIVSPVSVGGTLRGTGTVGGATTVQSGGTLAPGNSPGTLTFAAPVVMAPGSTLSLDIDGTGTGVGAGNFSRVVVTGAGNGFTAGGTLLPVLRGITGAATNSFTPSIGQQFTVVTAEGGVQGSFAGLAQPAGLAAGTRFDALYGPSSVSLVVTPAAYGNLGAAGLPQTASQMSIGQALDVLRPAAGLRMNGLSQSLFAPLYSLPAASIPQALDQLSPSLYGDMMLSARQGFYGFADQVSQRLGARRAAQGGAQVAAACGDACAGLPNAAPRSVAGPLGTTAWLSGFGQWTQVAAAAAPGFQSSLAGVMAGLDVELSPGFVGGVALGGGSANTFAGNGATALGSALQAMVYGEYAAGSFFLGGQVAYLLFDQTTTRPLGTWNSVSRDNLVTNGVGGQIAAGLRLGFDGWNVEPTVALAALSLSSPSTVEQNPNGLAQQVNGQSLTSVRGAVTLPVSRTLALADQRSLTVRGLVGWAHEFADVSATTQAAFAAAPGVGFTTTTAPIARDSALLGLSADFAVDDGVAFFAGWQGSIGSSSTAQTLRAGLRMTW